nr:MAG TPA: hypothetical protein [Caudoviricetes sp.]
MSDLLFFSLSLAKPNRFEEECVFKQKHFSLIIAKLFPVFT